MNLFKDFVKKYGLGMILGAVTLDGYRRQVINDNNNILEVINKERNSLSELNKKLLDIMIEEESIKTKSKAIFADKYKADPTDYNKNELIKSQKKLEESYEEIRKLDISEYLSSLYNKYNEFLDSLSPDKIVCLFNIIIDGLILSSFFSVLSIMLSENIINKISLLEKYPRLLKLLKLRSNINKKVSKFYLLIHLIIIIFGFLGNIFMFFI